MILGKLGRDRSIGEATVHVAEAEAKAEAEAETAEVEVQAAIGGAAIGTRNQNKIFDPRRAVV